MLPHTRFHLKTFGDLDAEIQNETSEDFLKCATRRRARTDFYNLEILEPMLKVIAHGDNAEVKLKAAKALVNVSNGFEAHPLFLEPAARLELLIRLGKMKPSKGTGKEASALRRAKRKKKDALTEAFELAGQKKITDYRDGIQVMIDYTSIQKEETQMIGCCILMNLAKSYELQSVMIAKGAMDALVRSMEVPLCQWYASAAIWNLSKHQRGMQAIRNVLNVLRSMDMVLGEGNEADRSRAGKSLELRLLLESIPIVLRQCCSHLPHVDFSLGLSADHMLVLGTLITSTGDILFNLSQYDYTPAVTETDDGATLQSSKPSRRKGRLKNKAEDSSLLKTKTKLKIPNQPVVAVTEADTAISLPSDIEGKANMQPGAKDKSINEETQLIQIEENNVNIETPLTQIEDINQELNAAPGPETAEAEAAEADFGKSPEKEHVFLPESSPYQLALQKLQMRAIQIPKIAAIRNKNTKLPGLLDKEDAKQLSGLDNFIQSIIPRKAKPSVQAPSKGGCNDERNNAEESIENLLNEDSVKASVQAKENPIHLSEDNVDAENPPKKDSIKESFEEKEIQEKLSEDSVQDDAENKIHQTQAESICISSNTNIPSNLDVSNLHEPTANISESNSKGRHSLPLKLNFVQKLRSRQTKS